MEHYYIGIDIGTSNIKAVLFDADLQQCYLASQTNSTIQLQENYCEQDMQQIIDKVLVCLIDVVQHSGVESQQIIAIGVTGQGEGAWLIGQDHRPLQPAIIWSDSRANDIIASLDQQVAQAILQETGSPPQPGNITMILAWLARYQPARREFSDINRFIKPSRFCHATC